MEAEFEEKEWTSWFEGAVCNFWGMEYDANVWQERHFLLAFPEEMMQSNITKELQDENFCYP
jgi:hypothetical protein